MGDSPNKDGGTPGFPNEIAQDITSPKLTSFDILSDNTITLSFDERLEPNSASEASGYRISDSSINSAHVIAPDTIRLSLGLSLKNARNYTMTIAGPKDIFGNAISQIDTSFTYYKISPVDSGDVVINEFMYAPSNSSEYVELYNHSDKSLNIQNWTLSDNRHQLSVITDSRVVIPPDSFAVLAPDNSLKQIFPDINLINMADRFPALNNGGDQIIIRNSHGVLLDSLKYNSNWGGDEVALERRSINLAANYPSNWGNSPNGFGTPGSDNQIRPDITPPLLASLTILDRRTMALRFSERLKSSTANNRQNYSLSGDIAIDKAVASAPDSVVVSLTTDLQNAMKYKLRVENISDIFGNTITPADTSFTYYQISKVDSGDVFINEFSYDPGGSSTEYVELYNPTAKSFDLKNWMLSDNRNLKASITKSPFIVPPDSFVVIAPDNSMLATNPNISLVVMNNFPSLNNSGDDIILRDANGGVIDSLQYSASWGGSEISLERRTISITGVYRENWGNSSLGGTPGRMNNISNDKTPPKLTSLHMVGNQKLKLVFNERLDENATRISNYTITNSGIHSARLIAADTVSLSLKSPLQNTQDYTVSISGLKDIFGNTIPKTDTTITYYKVSPVDSGDVAINEFMYAPPANSTEYIELYNYSNKSLNVHGWMLSDNRHDSTLISDTPFIVPPDSFAVLAPDSTLWEQHPDILLIDMGNKFPSLNNNQDQIIIRDSTGTMLDSLKYYADWGDDQVALERRTFGISGIYRENWGSSPSPNGGTPGRPNKINQDEQPPQLATLKIIKDNKLKISFDEHLDEAHASLAKNYSINDDGIINTRLEEKSVLLSLKSALQNTSQYTLDISGITDLFGNAIRHQDTTFTFYNVSPVDSGDVAINEFMFLPPANMTEYIEIYNHSRKSLDLNGWTLSDNRNLRAPISKEQFIVPPDSFVVLAPDNTISQYYPDISLLSMANRFPALNNGSDQIVIRDSSGVLLDSLQYSSGWGGNEVALERRNFQVPATYQSNWGNSPDPKGQTPGAKNEVPEDTSPPDLTALKIISDNTLKLIFDEPLKPSGETKYMVTGLSIDSVSNRANYVQLSLHSPLENAHQYTFSYSGLEDIFGNTADFDSTFSFYQTSPVDSGDIVINEFMYAPPANSTEYIELYNYSNKSLNVQGWMLSDNRHDSTLITDAPSIVPPDSFVVLAPDNTILKAYPDINLISMGNRFPALNNGSDQIIIRDSTGMLLDSLQYSAGWGGEEGALERRSTSITGTYTENWAKAPHGFGTPGSPNEIPPDNQAPTLTNLYSTDATTLHLVFSEKITSASATDIHHYRIDPNRDIQLVSVRDDSVTLFLASPLKSGQTYDLTISGLSDIFGNTLSSVAKQLKFVKIDKAQPGDIVLNEIMYNPAPGEADFVELYNTSNKNFDLTNWFIGDATGTGQLTKSVILPPDHYLILTGSQTFAQKYEKAIVVPDFPSLNNNRRDAVYIQRPDQTTIDSLYYSQRWGGSKEGFSMERKDPLDASNDASNWESSSSDTGYSAGQQNVSFHPDTKPPKIIFANTITPGNWVIYFNEFITLTDNLAFSMGGQALNIVDFDSTQGNLIHLRDKKAKKQESRTAITVKNVSDVKGNILKKSDISIAQPVNPGDLVINEIMYNPLDKADDNRPDQSEYIELRNTQNYAISLEGLSIHDAPDEKGNITELHPVTSFGKWVPAQGHVLIYAEDATSKFNQSKIANFFDLKSPDIRSIMQIERTGLGLASEGDAIYLADSSGTTIDSVYYDKSWQSPNLIDTKGIALERINPKGSSDDPSNWGSSVNPEGGTPDKENSIYQANPDKPEKMGISFHPNPFSPDGDGHEDNLFINYKLDQPDYLIRVRIYDRYGRLVRKLADGKPAGFEGQLIWNGRKNDGSRNRIGIYIVIFEAFNSSNGSDKSFKKPVVLARKLN